RRWCSRRARATSRSPSRCRSCCWRWCSASTGRSPQSSSAVPPDRGPPTIVTALPSGRARQLEHVVAGARPGSTCRDEHFDRFSGGGYDPHGIIIPCRRRRMRSLVRVVTLVTVLLAVATLAHAQEVTLSAAISMKDAVEELGRGFMASH